jgi:hypothetical protein
VTTPFEQQMLINEAARLSRIAGRHVEPWEVPMIHASLSFGPLDARSHPGAGMIPRFPTTKIEPGPPPTEEELAERAKAQEEYAAQQRAEIEEWRASNPTITNSYRDHEVVEILQRRKAAAAEGERLARKMAVETGEAWRNPGGKTALPE